MSTFVKFFTKSKKNSANKENNENNLKRVNFERASTRSEVGTDPQREPERVAMRAIPNPFSVWTEPKKTRGPSSCPGVALDSSAYERRSVRQPKHERAGSVYGDMGQLREYRIDGPYEPTAASASSHHHGHRLQQPHRSSRRHGELSMIEERSERSERSDRSVSKHDGWTRSSTRRPHPSARESYVEYTSGESDDDDISARMRRLQEHNQQLRDKCQQLREDKSRYRFQLDNTKNELEYTQYELRNALDRGDEMEMQLKQQKNARKQELRRIEQLERALIEEKEKTEQLERRCSEMSSSASNGAMERLVSSSETSLEMSREELREREVEEEEQEEEEKGVDEVRNFRAAPTAPVAAAAAEGVAAADAVGARLSALLQLQRDDDEMEVPRRSETASPQFELRRSASDMGPMSGCGFSGGGYTIADGAGEEMAAMGGSWRRQRRRMEKSSFVKRSMLPSSGPESESSDGERVLLMERQLRKKGSLVKYEPNRRVHVKEKHYRKFGKPERSALDRFTFLESEVTDVSGMLSSPNENNY